MSWRHRDEKAQAQPTAQSLSALQRLPACAMPRKDPPTSIDRVGLDRCQSPLCAGMTVASPRGPVSLTLRCPQLVAVQGPTGLDWAGPGSAAMPHSVSGSWTWIQLPSPVRDNAWLPPMSPQSTMPTLISHATWGQHQRGRCCDTRLDSIRTGHSLASTQVLALHRHAHPAEHTSSLPPAWSIWAGHPSTSQCRGKQGSGIS